MIDIWWLERIEEESLCVVGFNLCHDLYTAPYFTMLTVLGYRKQWQDYRLSLGLQVCFATARGCVEMLPISLHVQKSCDSYSEMNYLKVNPIILDRINTELGVFTNFMGE